MQAYNAQAAVDAHAQIIVAQNVTQSSVDCSQLVPMIDAVEANLGRKPAQASADSGYCSESNLEALESRHIDGYVATGRAKDWRKRNYVPRKPASVEPASVRQLEQNLSDYFHKMQGRGENCKVDCYRRGARLDNKG